MSPRKGNSKRARPESITSGKDSGSRRALARGGKSGRVKSFTTVVAGPNPIPPKDGYRAIKGSLDSAGRILVPAKLRKALDLGPGDEVNIVLRGDVLEIRSLDDTINEAQALVRKFVQKKESLVDEFIAERRAEAEKE